MSITLTDELEQTLIERANQLSMPPDELVVRTVTSYLQFDPELAAELRDGQQMSWDSWAKVEEILK